MDKKGGGVDPQVKKTLVRNCELVVKPTRKQVVRDVSSSSKLPLDKPSSSRARNKILSTESSRVNQLGEPTLCSSEALAQYLTDIKKSAHSSVSNEDLNINKGQLCAKMTKKLNFHFNDRIYKNLIELNASLEEVKSRKDKRPSSTIKKDLEPNIEDFYEDTREFDSLPNIPVMRPKFKPIKKVENGDLHRLAMKFECL